MLKEILYISLVLVVLVSCDCEQRVRGTVLDSETEKPIKNVHVFKKISSHDDSQTDSTGTFEIESISGGLFGCPGMTIVLEKDGYEKQT